MRRLAPGTWQHAMLEANAAALRVALQVLAPRPGAQGPRRGELEACRPALADLAARARKARAAFAPGTAQHTLQRDRLAALQAARRAVGRALRGRTVAGSARPPQGIS